MRSQVSHAVPCLHIPPFHTISYRFVMPADESAVVIQRLRKVFPPRGKAGTKVAVVDLNLVT